MTLWPFQKDIFKHYTTSARKPKSLTLNLNAFNSLRHSQVVLHGTFDLLIVVFSRDVEDLKVESELSFGLLVADVPFVAMFVRRRISFSRTSESGLKRRNSNVKVVAYFKDSKS